MLDLLIALWTTLIHGEIPLYSCNEHGGNPAANKEERVIRLIQEASKVNGPALARAILAARVCDPETFVERTIQRMVTLPKLYTLRHLSFITSSTVEHRNVGYIVSITEALVCSDVYLRTLFTRAKAPQAYIPVVEQSLRAFGVHMGRELVQLPDMKQDPNNSTGRMTRALAQMAPYVGALVSWAASASISTITLMKDVIACGAAKLLLDHFGILFRLPLANRFPADAIWDMMEDYALHSKIIPVLCQNMRESRFVLSKPLDPDSTFARDGRDADVKGVAKRILDLERFIKHSVAICDNSMVSGLSSYHLPIVAVD
jgi:hypothetical protein